LSSSNFADSAASRCSVGGHAARAVVDLMRNRRMPP
jgi:hypothetical protein